VRTISKKTKYGLRALLALGKRNDTKPVQIGTLAKEEDIPLKFLQAILLELKSRGIIDSKSGPGGGCKLTRPADQISIGEVIRVLEGPLAPLPCASETAYRPCSDCTDVASCGTRIVMRQVRDAISGVLDHTTLADVVERAQVARDQKASAEDTLMYYI
jgi:Rrf2 family protein